MKYTVVWDGHAEAELARIWLAASSSVRSEIRVSCEGIERALSHGPQKIGATRSGETRIVVLRPLAVTIEIREEDLLVIVHAVQQI